MLVAETIDELGRGLARLREEGKRIAFVPTMGNLHAGHRQLMEEARRRADVVVASVYVNPLQFGPSEDFSTYPRTPKQDRVMLEATGVDLLFLPDDATIYPRGRDSSTRIEVPGISDILCGVTRPGHFRGVATVVHRLFQLVVPDMAIFGKKDYQQLMVIRLMSKDFGLPVEIVGLDTVRDQDGLALSSRNAYLSLDERKTAPQLYSVLNAFATRLSRQAVPERGYLDEEKKVLDELEVSGFRPDYVSVRRQQDLALPVPPDSKLVILAAAWLGRTRLIDNVEVELTPLR